MPKKENNINQIINIRKRTHNEMEEESQKLINTENKMNNSFIISEINIKEEDINKEIRIMNSFEEWKRNINYKNNDDYEYENEKEIKEKCQIKINDKIIIFNYFYKFDKQGKNVIKYIFKDNIIKADFMFCQCKSLNNINISYFNTQNITNMKHMFNGCSSLLALYYLILMLKILLI